MQASPMCEQALLEEKKKADLETRQNFVEGQRLITVAGAPRGHRAPALAAVNWQPTTICLTSKCCPFATSCNRNRRSALSE